MNKEKDRPEQTAAPREQGRGSEPEHDPRAPGSSAADEPGPFARARAALLTPVRWLRSRLTGGLRWLRRGLKRTLRPILGLLGQPRKERGFGFWWLVTTLLLAAAVAILVAALLTPVLGIVAFLIVVIWSLARSAGAGRGESRDAASAATTS